MRRFEYRGADAIVTEQCDEPGERLRKLIGIAEGRFEQAELLADWTCRFSTELNTNDGVLAVVWNAVVVAPVGRIVLDEVVGAFPLLVQDGRNVVAQQTGVPASFGPARHPRSAIGWSRDGSFLYWVLVDGRQPPYSAGMTLDELAALFLRLGADHAINLDGGGSSALVVRGAVLNRPSDPQGERAVGNALALQRCEAR